MRDDWFVSVPDSKPGGGLEFMGRRYTTGAAYVEAVEAQANAQREAAAARILSMLNSRTKQSVRSCACVLPLPKPGRA